ncbi:AAA family ATPase [Dyella solisilvae]|nr:ATP-binding protein [Dyella solisilvae]
MFEAIATSPQAVDPFDHLLARRDMATLWIMRILLRMCDEDWLWKRPSLRRQLFSRLQLLNVQVADEEQRHLCIECLSCTLDAMEEQASLYCHDPVLAANLDLLSGQLSLSSLEAKVLSLAVLLRSDDLIDQLADETFRSINLPRQLAMVLDEPIEELAQITHSAGLLHRTGLIEFSSGGPLAGNISVKRGSLRRLATISLSSPDELFDGIVRAAPHGQLQLEDYAHVKETLDALHHLIGEALERQRTAVNVLLYGPPGTGKTQLARWLADQLATPLYDVSPHEMGGISGTGERPDARLAKAATCLHLLRGRRAMLAMDECDAIFGEGTGPLSGVAANPVKAWVNDLLETNPVPMIWIANSVRDMDSAFVRRFDMVVRLDTPPMKQRLKLLEQACGQHVSHAQLRRIAAADKATPGVLTRAIDVMDRVHAHGGEQNSGALLESLLDGTLRAQGHPTIHMAYRHSAATDYDTRFCNANVDLDALSEGLRRTGQGRILLYGPPGTGKTAFGHWLATALERPLVLKRVSDLQSRWVGEMEQNLARAFEQALREEAVLQIDEVDGFLQDRRYSSHGWERTQVNEFLTQLESFEGIFIGSTNLLGGLEPAAMRRFDHKIEMGYLQPEQAWLLFQRKLSDWGVGMPDADDCRRRLAGLTRLTPGDFSLMARRHALIPYRDASTVVGALSEELNLKDGPARRIGFT